MGGEGILQSSPTRLDPARQPHRVYVGNLSWNVDKEQLRQHMSEAGEVVFAEVLTEPSGRSKGCGIVEYATPAQASSAMERMHNTTLNGRAIFVREDREHGGGGGGGGPMHHHMAQLHHNGHGHMPPPPPHMMGGPGMMGMPPPHSPLAPYPHTMMQAPRAPYPGMPPSPRGPVGTRVFVVGPVGAAECDSGWRSAQLIWCYCCCCP